MGIKIIRLIFILACAIMGGIWASHLVETIVNPARATAGNALFPPGPWQMVGGLLGLAVAVTVLFCLRLVTQEIFEKLSPALVAIVLALIMGYGTAQYILGLWNPDDEVIAFYFTTTLVLLFAFMGISLGLTRASQWESLISAVGKRHAEKGSAKLIDTSVIIDGRIADICQSGFVEGTLLIPRFVLKELQNIADSPDALRRARGRRGLDILKMIQDGETKLDVKIIEDDPIDVREVDGKLVRLARLYSAKVLTNDYNLNKVAQIEGVEVLNVNDLANALKPAVLPDEQMTVKLIKEGKEAFQGVGYLDDGTMVVVDGGKDWVGKEVSVVVTSVLQTSAGRMIFTKLVNVVQ
ncbi:MAG TPA: TRAM domain-containing protein [Candidatus Hydrogenedentes bacterium]|nr:TRAM domain-containing protein [Candidatus Hydrogenedentota bacterium]